MEESNAKMAVNNDNLTEKPRVNPNMHKGNCTICKSPLCKELEARYIDGEGVYDLQREMGFDNKTIYLHVKAFSLDKKRDNSTLNLVNRLISKVDITKLDVNIKTYVAALQLRAKLKGEIVDKQEIDDKSNAKYKSTKQLDAEIIEIINESEGSDRAAVSGKTSTG